MYVSTCWFERVFETINFIKNIAIAKICNPTKAVGIGFGHGWRMKLIIASTIFLKIRDRGKKQVGVLETIRIKSRGSN